MKKEASRKRFGDKFFVLFASGGEYTVLMVKLIARFAVESVLLLGLPLTMRVLTVFLGKAGIFYKHIVL